ncbi:SOSS complex subunit C isoform X1 [Peromyscus eremicus]|uniref:SOSS complex subunit C isoform X1 n=1 Tax=Peromyscus eremicus TaxID=42410 RepID=UPI0027DD8EB3|nr:SOSS complex subunit C isoform X1 [Peromyscus eremicus]
MKHKGRAYLVISVFKIKTELRFWLNWTKKKENYLCRTNLQQVTLELASPSPDPLLIRTFGIMLSSSTLQPSRRQLFSHQWSRFAIPSDAALPGFGLVTFAAAFFHSKNKAVVSADGRVSPTEIDTEAAG